MTKAAAASGARTCWDGYLRPSFGKAAKHYATIERRSTSDSFYSICNRISMRYIKLPKKCDLE